MTPEERLRWLESNQPRNTAAINAMRSKMGIELVPEAPKKPKEDWRKIVAKSSGKPRGFRITPYHHWQNRGASSN